MSCGNSWYEVEVILNLLGSIVSAILLCALFQDTNWLDVHSDVDMLVYCWVFRDSKHAAPATMPTNGLKVLWAYEYAQKRKNRTGKFKGSLPGN
jgi:hypothetical protein